MSDSTSGIINPNTPDAFLTPQEAHDARVVVLVQAAALGILVWDILEFIPTDFRMIFKRRPTLTSIIYVASRVCTLAFMINLQVFTSDQSLWSCASFLIVVEAFYPAALGLNGLLFFFRLRAIYNKNRIVVGCFFILWCGLVVATTFLPVAVKGGTIGPTNSCVQINIPVSAYAAVGAPLVNDTLVFLAISWRLAYIAHLDGSLKQNLRAALLGKYLPIFSKSLLRDGQSYYLISLAFNLATVIMGSLTSIPAPFRSLFISPSLVVLNIMACRVYRWSKMGRVREHEISTSALLETDILHGQGHNIVIELATPIPTRRRVSLSHNASSQSFRSNTETRSGGTRLSDDIGVLLEVKTKGVDVEKAANDE